ncbi:MAG: 1-deoxy-D-xylulose-5-phosphate synthase [Gammaproteobacteria bacterium]|jgi:1-deoxy-D-xylulose-5-phosphate synthase
MTTITPTFTLLNSITSPEMLRGMDESELTAFADELRAFFLHSINQSGGHFAANLGTIELTVAMHYVFNTPKDKLVWDVGHQAYAHKILTERRDEIHNIRKAGGLSAFPKRSESIYDTFGVGHSSTSISAALGMALAAKQQNQDYKVAAIIGDGAMTAGMAFEALNHAGAIHADLLVVLNDNDMSISGNVGALSNYFARILSGKTYISMREGSKKVLNVMPKTMKEIAKRAELHMKGMMVPGTLFEELGFNYIGPIDGHDLPLMIKTLKNIYPLKGPKLLHVVTKKGKGFAPAEADPIKYHAVSPGFLDEQKKSNAIAKPTYSQIFGDWLCDMATQSEQLVAVTPAMCEGSGMVNFAKTFPDRYHDVGIAEQHSVTLAAGMACQGLKPVVAIYSTFLQRAYDQLIHDVALQDLDVLFAIDRAGLVGQDAPTHNGSFDLSFLNCIPNMIIMAPSNEQECRDLLTTGFNYPGPAAVRYPRGSGTGAPINKELKSLPIGQARICREGQDIAILSFGTLLSSALAAAEELNATVVDMRFIKPLDTHTILKCAKNHSLIVTLEENTIIGGAGSAVNQVILNAGIVCRVLNLGLSDEFSTHDTHEALLARFSLDKTGILQSIARFSTHETKNLHYQNS